MRKEHMDTIDALRQAIEALQNVPEVGDVYDQQHSDTQMAAILSLEIVLRALKAKGE